MISLFFQVWLLLVPVWAEGGAVNKADDIYIRINQVGYLTHEQKSAILFSARPVKEKIALIHAETGKKMYEARPLRSQAANWGAFDYYYTLDFSEVITKGSYFLQGVRSGIRSQGFQISEHAYDQLQEELLGFMRQQRCGYNPFLDMVCHQRDGRSFYGPMPDSTYVDVSGGWHDA
jgi:hypothetical protein